MKAVAGRAHVGAPARAMRPMGQACAQRGSGVKADSVHSSGSLCVQHSLLPTFLAPSVSSRCSFFRLAPSRLAPSHPVPAFRAVSFQPTVPQANPNRLANPTRLANQTVCAANPLVPTRKTDSIAAKTVPSGPAAVSALEWPRIGMASTFAGALELSVG
jgi:hypothetical protein